MSISGNDGEWALVNASSLPLAIHSASVMLVFTPMPDQPSLCNGHDSFNATAQNLNMPGTSGYGPSTVISLSFGCENLVCPAGQQAQNTSSGVLCFPCAPGTYNLDVNSYCKPCPTGALCSGGSALAAMEDYWFYGTEFYPCETGRCCVTVSHLWFK